MALKITGQLKLNDDIIIGDNTSYATLTTQYLEEGKGVNILVDVFKGKSAYTSGKAPYPQVVEINRVYSFDKIILDTAPTSGFGALPGKSLLDKQFYWIHQRVMEQILLANPTFTITIGDIQL